MNKIFGLICILPIFCFCSFSAKSLQAPTVYIIEESPSIPNTLIVHLDLSGAYPTTQLVLRGVSMGISKQVKNMVCDGKPIKENKPGIWNIPKNCHKLQWQVPLLEGGDVLASTQQSTKLGDFILFSEASSLPRVQGAASEILRLSIPHIKITFPNLNTNGEITLPGNDLPPLFIILNPNVVGTESSDSIKLTYLLDNPAAISKLPSMASHLKGMKWLRTIIGSTTKEDLTIAWLGISAKSVSVAGAAGNGILFTNYPKDGHFPFGQAILLYVGLHEAFHQFAINYPEQPVWAAESLASYYGIKALQAALPNNPDVSALTERFLEGATHFQSGLLTINCNIEKGDRSEYGAFYTKGIAFWMAIDKALEKQGDSLNAHLQAVLQTKYDINGEPIDLQQTLNLSPETWHSLRKSFLE